MDFDDQWVLELLDIIPPDSVANLNSRDANIDRKKPRRYRTVDLLDTKREMADLQDQLQKLEQRNALHRSLDEARFHSGLDWSTFAKREKIKTTMAVQENARLRKRVEAKVRRIQRILCFTRQQKIEAVPRSVQLCCRIVRLDNEARTFQALQACLDIRSNGELDAIVDRCRAMTLETTSTMREIQWETLALSDRDVGVEFHESVVIPFDASFTASILYRKRLLNALQIRQNNVGDLYYGI